MSDAPQTWHYGLLARWWAEFNRASPDELAYLRRCSDRFGQPVLDLACGTGRLLLPLRQAGLDIDGCDLSADMLAECRQQAAAAGVTVRLYQQAMHALDLPRRYRTIYLWDSFGIGGQRQQDRAALVRCWEHLEPGGALVLSHEFPYANADQWPYWRREARQQLPQAWPESKGRRAAANGDEFEFLVRMVDLDPLEQRLTLQSRMGLWRAGTRVAQEEHTLQTTLYFRNEVLLLLEHAGFGEITVYGDTTERALTTEDDGALFVARKAG
jgi:SAM-dependent methyltransferase